MAKNQTLIANRLWVIGPETFKISYLPRLFYQSVSLPLPSKKLGIIMARVCQVTGKRPVSGNKVSHSNIKTKRRFLPNLQTKRYFLAEENKWIVLKVSGDAIRTINKNGLYSVIKGLRAQGQHI